ncbi:ankyrin repeat domain-containing protein [Massilia sp. Dwa41.01b]|uniref:ankyrin repeat domain-containing protein n=1 Tax=unclassified Massilia TaxID=2609279 RepID=UPI0015FEE09F|nr:MULTISPECIES: ankyrin repeat domain-containing protein [unclassified Massilia]QNA90207.1 ankyrin repeat domain-containing protein [Massilia sp. Dwa41.01b]QNB01094.1 ankyrin repeat domain-containing protein [Massilia sp. Se16.2.3]
MIKTIQEVYRHCGQTGAWYGIEIARFDQRNFMNDTVLHTVCSWGDFAAVKVLVAAGADVNARGDRGATPLFNAVMGGNPEVVSFLLKAGADPRIPNGYERQVVDYARNVSASDAIVGLLVKAAGTKERKR